jgi:hypothetical protein
MWSNRLARSLRRSAGLGSACQKRAKSPSEDDNAIRSCALDWNGENKLIPFLPGIAFDQYFPNSAKSSVASACSKDASTTSILFESDPGLPPDVRHRIVDAWLALCDETGLSSAQAGLPDRGRLLVYGFALGAVREFALVAQEHGDAEREGRRPVI